ncbi:MAG: DNA polymerase III subunit delta [Actinomycetota bacterium]
MPDAAVVLLWGDDEYLLRLAARDVLEGSDVQATEVDGRDWRGGETADLSTPSLWGDRRALLVTGSQDLPDAGKQEVAGYVKDPAPGAILVLTAVSRAKAGPALAKVVREAGAAVRQVSLRRQDLPKWIIDRAGGRSLRLSGPAATTLISMLGEDPAVLDQSVEQLAAAFAGRAVGPDEVRQQFQGLGEQRVWDLCDRAFGGRTAEALVVLRALLEAREDPLMILGGIAARLRDLIRVRGLPDHMAAAEAARAAGLRFEWQLRRYREQAARYSLGELTWLLERATDTDRAIKGGTPGDVAIAAFVTAIAGERDAALDVPARVGR